LQNRKCQESNFAHPYTEGLSRWVAESRYSLDIRTIQNAWRKTGYSYFPEE